MDNKYLIYESGYLSFDIIETEKKRVTSHSFQFFLSYSCQLCDYTLKSLENYDKI